MQCADAAKRPLTQQSSALRLFIACHRTWSNLSTREQVNEKAVFEAAKGFLEKEFGVPVHITEAESSEHAKAATALPFKPAIIIE